MKEVTNITKKKHLFLLNRINYSTKVKNIIIKIKGKKLNG